MIMRIPPKPHHELVDYLAAMPIPSYIQDKDSAVWMKTGDGWVRRGDSRPQPATTVAHRAPLTIVGGPS